MFWELSCSSPNLSLIWRRCTFMVWFNFNNSCHLLFNLHLKPKTFLYDQQWCVLLIYRTVNWAITPCPILSSKCSSTMSNGFRLRCWDSNVMFAEPLPSHRVTPSVVRNTNRRGPHGPNPPRFPSAKSSLKGGRRSLRKLFNQRIAFGWKRCTGFPSIIHQSSMCIT